MIQRNKKNSDPSLPPPSPLSPLIAASIAAWADAVASSTPQLSLVVNNAGVGGSSALSMTGDGFENIFQSNHLVSEGCLIRPAHSAVHPILSPPPPPTPLHRGTSCSRCWV